VSEQICVTVFKLLLAVFANLDNFYVTTHKMNGLDCIFNGFNPKLLWFLNNPLKSNIFITFE